MKIQTNIDDSLKRGKFADLKYLYAISAVLVATVFPLNIGSIAIIIFILFSISRKNELKFKFNFALVLPIALYVLMAVSLFWTHDIIATLNGLQKEAVFLVLPIIFMLLPKISKEAMFKIIRIYSFGMVAFAIFCFARAIIKYNEIQTNEVFLFHNLVTVDLNAIYVAAFSSLCLFYFIILENKKPLDYFGLYILAIFVLLLNSKTVFFIDMILLAWHYTMFSKTKLGVKSVTILFIVTFLLLSVFFIKQVQDRIIAEYETAFVDNTIYKNPIQGTGKIVSLKNAWNADSFEPNSYFPGTAYRIFQARVFTEIMQQNNTLWIVGLGFNASDNQIKEKHRQHNLFKDINYHNFHNQYVQLFAELGFFGFLLLIIIVFLNLKNAITHKNFLHIAFAFTIIVLFLTESLLCRQRGIVFFVTLYCLFNKVDYGLKSTEHP